MSIAEQRTLPAPFVETLGKDLATQITAQSAIPVVAPGAGGITQLAGESAADFARRQQAAQQFDIRQQSLAGLAPQVAEAGIGSFQPFLQQAQAAGTAAGTALGGISTGPMTTAQTQQFMSPYQSQVIDATMAEF